MVSLFAASAALLFGSVGQAQEPVKVDTTPSLIVTGSSEVRVAPDLAVLQIGVTTQAKTAQAAQNESNTKTSTFLDKVKGMLGSNGTVQTGTVNLYPVFSEPPQPNNAPFTPQIVGYRADNTLIIRTSDFTQVGPVIDTAVAAGFNNIQSVDFQLLDDTDARMKALANAVQQARKKAEVMAQAAGVELSGIWQISEQGAQVTPMQAVPMMARAGEGGAPTPVIPGAVVVSGDVTIKFFIRGGTKAGS